MYCPRHFETLFKRSAAENSALGLTSVFSATFS
jgi:hypothetical protein